MLIIIPNLAYWLFNLTILDTLGKMISINPFSILAETVSPMVMQIFVITNICITNGCTVSASIENGFIDIIFLQVSSTVKLNNQ